MPVQPPTSMNDVVEGGSAWVKLPTPMVLGEAPLYRATDATLHYVDCLKEPAELHILQLDPKTGDATSSVPIIHKLEDSVTVACFRKGITGSYICAYYQGVALLDEATGKLEVLKEIIPTSQRAELRFNDGGVDPGGRFWLAEIDKIAMGYGPNKLPKEYGEPKGRLWRYDPDGSVHEMEKGLICGNGIAWSPDSKTMYLNDSVAMYIHAYDFDVATGNISNKRMFIDRREVGGEPDGMVVDVQGNLWIAMWGTHCVMAFNPAGELIKTIKFSAKNMACTAWGGPNNDELYIASAMDRSGVAAADDEGGHLFRWKVGVQGVPKYEFGA